jgi:pimeloyl-ACP methyl ester carboxylesterase
MASALHVPDARDRELLTAIARARRANPEADIRSPAAGLTPGGRALLALAQNTDPDRVPALMAALPEPLRGDIDLLDLKRYPLGALDADFLLIHGRDDPLIPASESRALAAALPPGRADAFIVGNLSHVDIGPGGIFDTLLLWRAAYRLLTLRDRLTVPDPALCAPAMTSGSG